MNPGIIKEVYQQQTPKMVNPQVIHDIKQRIKKDSYHWYNTMRVGHYEYIHEFKESIDEILRLQKKHRDIIDTKPNPEVQQCIARRSAQIKHKAF